MLISCPLYILSFGEFSSLRVLQKSLQVVKQHNWNTLPCPFMWNFITSPISLEKITSKQKIVALCRCPGPGLPGTVRGLCGGSTTTACRWRLTSSPQPARRLGTGDVLDPCHCCSLLQEQGQSEQQESWLKSFLSLSAAWWRKDVQELPHWMCILQTHVQLEAGYSMLPSQWSTLGALVASQASQLSAALLAPLQRRTSTTSTGSFLLCLLGFSECLPSPVSWAYWTHICCCLCVYALLRPQVELGFPNIIFFHCLQVWAMYLHAYGHTLQLESAGATKSHPGWGPGSPLLPG